MTDNKPKIDLKSRLGKKTVSSPSGHSIPPPAALRPGGIPAPPFGSRPAPVDPSNPYSAMDASSAPTAAKPAAIKIEMSEEVRQEQRKQSKKYIWFAVIAAIIGVIAGYMIGGASERRGVAAVALRDAEALAKDLKAAMAGAETLADTVKSAREKVASGKYPDEELSKLGGLRIPFGGDKLGGRNIGRFNAQVSKGLLAVAGEADKINDQVDTVQRLLTGTRKALNDVFQQNASPKVFWAAVAEGGPHGPMLNMLAIPEPFPLKVEKGGWPDSIKFKIEGKEVSVKRYSKGDPQGNDPLYIPVDPTSQAGVCPQDVVFRVTRQLQDLEGLIRGVKDPSGHEESGIIDTGRALEEKLKAIGTPG